MKKSNVIFFLSRIHAFTHRFISEEIEKSGLPGLAPSHGDIMFQLFRHKKLTMMQLGEKIGRDKSTVTALISKMENFDLIKREIDPSDKRISLISLTEKALAFQPSFEQISEKLVSHFFHSLDEKESEEIDRLLEKIYTNW